MVKQFKGEVKISDVQAEFDALVGRINKMVDAYNGTNQVITNIDYTKGGSNLAPSGYTLTVGGIKQALKSLDGHVVGGKCFYNTATTVKMSDGLLFTKGGVFRLPDSILDRPSNGNSIWYDTNKEEYVWGQKRVSGRQTLTEEGATEIVKSGNGYRNYTNDVGRETKLFTQGADSGTTVISFSGAEEDTEADYHLKLPLKRFIHKSIPLESTEVEFSIMRNGTLTINSETNTYIYSGSNEMYAVLGYYQDGYFRPYLVVGNGCPYLKQNGWSIPCCGKNAIPEWHSSIDTKFAPAVSHNDIDIIDSKLYYSEKNATLSYKTSTNWYNVEAQLITDNINKPEGVDTGKHSIDGIKFRIFHPSPYSNSTEKANPDSLKAKLVCQMDILNSSGEVIKYWDEFRYKDGSTTVESKGIMSRPVFSELGWTSEKTDGELGSGREKYIAENSPLGQCNMILFSTPSTTDHNGNIFKQSEYNPTFNVTTGTYEVWDAQGKPDPDCYHITDYATARDSDYRNDLKNLQVQDLDGTFKITVKNRLFNGIAAAGSSQTIDTSSKAKFVCAGDVIRTEGQGVASVSLLGTEVSYNSMAGHKKLCYWYPCNYLYLPKGVGSPYSETNGRPSLMCQFPFDVNVEKDLS